MSNSLFWHKQFKNNSDTWDHLFWASVPIAPHKKASLHSTWRASQKTLTAHNCRHRQIMGSPAPMDASTPQLLQLWLKKH